MRSRGTPYPFSRRKPPLRPAVDARSTLMQQAQEFWDGLFRTRSEPGASLVDMPDRECPVYRRAVQHFGPMYGKTLIDLGSGAGASSLYFASLGADVISVDLSPIAVENL